MLVVLVLVTFMGGVEAQMFQDMAACERAKLVVEANIRKAGTREAALACLPVLPVLPAKVT